MKFAGGPRYTNMCECLRFSCSCRALRGPSRLPRQPRSTAQSGHQHSSALLHLLPFLFRPLYAFLHSLRLPLFHALSSQNTVGGGQLEYLEFPWAPLSRICPLWGVGNFPHLIEGLLNKWGKDVYCFINIDMCIIPMCLLLSRCRLLTHL